MKLYLKDGTVIEGESFGANKNISGEVVFNTGMVGYPEAFTDPSYAGQILVLTYPLVGNYGVPDKKFWESEKVQIAGLVVSEYSEQYSHHTAKQSLGEWLKKSDVPAITGVDTRALTKKLREKGVMLGQIIYRSIYRPTRSIDSFTDLNNVYRPTRSIEGFTDPNKENLVARVSPKKSAKGGSASGGKKIYEKGKIKIVAVDCGIKENIIRSLVRPETTVIRVPWNYDFTKEKYDALVLGNGPGDPTMVPETIQHVQAAMAAGKPILGVCLGNQLLALAAGASTYKLKYGHRSQNQPCIETSTKRCYITSQNHGYAVDAKKLPEGWAEWFVNANDGSNEGIRHKTKPFRSVQFHPEASPGPTDASWIFDDFLREVRISKSK